MKKFIVVLAVIIVLLAAGLGFGGYYYPRMKADQEVGRFLESLPEVSESSYGKVDFSLIDKKLIIPDLKLRVGKGDPVVIEMANIEIIDPKLENMEKVLGSAGAAEGTLTGLLALAESVLVEGVKISGDGGGVTLGKLVLDNPRAGQFPAATLEDNFSEENVAKLALALGADQVVLEKIRAADDKDDMEIGYFGSIRLAGYESGKFESVSLEGVNISPPREGTVSLKSFSTGAMDFQKLLEMAAQGQEPTPESFAMGTYGDVHLKGLEVTAEDEKNVKLEEFSITELDKKGMVLTSLNVEVKGLEIETKSIDRREAEEILGQLGYDKLVFNAGFRFVWDAATKTLEVKNLSVGINDAGTLSISLSVEGADPEALEAGGNPTKVLPELLFKRAEIRYQDESLAPRALKMAAQMQGMDPEELRAMLLAQIDGQKAMAGTSPQSEQAVASVKAFITSPGSLTITAEPSAPVPLMKVAGQASMSPDTLAESLNILITASAADPGAVKPAPSEAAKPEAKAPAAAPAQPEEKTSQAKPEEAAPAKPEESKATLKQWMKKGTD